MGASKAATPMDRFSRERASINAEVIERVTRMLVQESWNDSDAQLGELLNEAAFVELRELDGAQIPLSSRQHKQQRWREIVRNIQRATPEEHAEVIERVVTEYVADVQGHYRARVHNLATSLLPATIGVLFSPDARGDLLSLSPSHEAFSSRVSVEGEVGKVRRLAERGTLVYASTHSSRLDAFVLGWAMHAAGLPPVIHGADSHLYHNYATGFVMANTGAYRVDRSRKHRLYTETLKAYSQVLLEHGFHSSFFPAAGRSRSNTIQTDLKLGLLGTALNAQVRTMIEGRSRPLFVVPVTMNYTLILEAETLVDDFLKSRERRRSIIPTDEFSDVRRVVGYLKNMMNLDDFVTVRIGSPMDVFGNSVDHDGASIDEQGRKIDIERYLWNDGVPVADRQRDFAYTRGLGRKLVSAMQENNVIYPLHIVSLALFEHARRQHPNWSVDRLLQFARGDTIHRYIADGETKRVMRIVRRDAERGALRLSRSAERLQAHEMVTDALDAFGRHHTKAVLASDGEHVRMHDLRLLFFYSNRLRGYDLERRLKETPGGY